MNKIKRFIDCNVPTQICNLKCPYCYVGQVDGFSGKIEPIQHSPQKVRQALSKERMGGIILINFCGTGETLLGEDILPIIHEVLLEGHFVQIVTNGTMNKRFDEIASWNRELLDRLLVKFSYHYDEFKRLNKLDDFFENVRKVKNAGGSISVEVTSGDNLIEFKDELNKRCYEELGALPHVTVVRDSSKNNYPILSSKSDEEYASIWKDNASKMFEYKMEILGKKREEFCYGGEWTFYLYLSNGDLKQCYRGDVIDNIFEDISRPIRFNPIGRYCHEPYCFNGHAWMTLGCIPNISAPTYADMRNRTTVKGEEWLSETVKEFMSHKLQENNIVYSNVSETPKILLLGDSISKGYREYVKETFEGMVDVYYPNEIVTFSNNMLRYVHEIAEKLLIGSNIDMVYFNVGLWDVLKIYGDNPIIDKEMYLEYLKRIVHRMRFIFPNSKLVFATTTPVKEELAEYKFNRFNMDIDDYNESAISMLKDQNVYVHDLNQFASNHLQDEYVDFTHFSADGYKQLSEEIVRYISLLTNSTSLRSEKSAIQKADEEIASNKEYLNNSRIILYGAGLCCTKTLIELRNRNISPFVILDRDIKKQTKDMCGVKIVSPAEYMDNLCNEERDLVIICVYDTQIQKDISNTLLERKRIKVCSYKVINDK